MITLFRRIRQKLINSGSVTKYLFYAIGEILLVVIGILIALQVNNWNENIKVEQKTRVVMTEIKQNLEQDLSSITTVNNLNMSIIRSLSRLSEKPEIIPDDSLATIFNLLHRASAFDPVTFGYSKLQDLDLPENTPDSLTRALAEYYTEFDGGLNNIAYEDLSIYNINKYREYMISKGFPVPFQGSDEIETAGADVLRNISKDPAFRGIVRSNHFSRNIQRLGFEEARSMASGCIRMIESYLNIPESRK